MSESSKGLNDNIARFAAKNAYRYRSLQHPDSVRILKLWPGHVNDAEIFCNFVDHRLSQGFAYEAISYTWGEPSFSHRVLSPRGFLKVTRNLATALVALRYVDQPRYLWVDASPLRVKV